MVRYMGPLLRQMHYLATSKVAVLDSYCIPACLFPKRDGLKVIQMWHALGAMKKFSKSILDKPEGKSSKIASLMKMHEGYDYIFTSSEKARPAFAEAFGYPPERLTIMSLPRVDVIMDKELDRRNKERILEKYPFLADKETILYAPTLRIGKDMTGAAEALIDAVDTDKYNLILSMHPLTEISVTRDLPENVILRPDFSTTELMAASDYVITDYSAVTYDAALKGLPLYFYAFDKDEYLRDREFYLDYDRDMPGPVCASAEETVREIGSGRTDEYRSKARAFADLYIEKKENCTAEIADLIEKLL
jgi:CDP-ribitol ribitolphosphotransferase